MVRFRPFAVLVTLAVLAGCTSSEPAASEGSQPAGAQPAGSETAAARAAADPEFPTEGVPFAQDRRLGPPVVVANLTLWPVYSERVIDLGEFWTLQEAQEQGVVEIREIGGSGGAQTAQVQTINIEPVNGPVNDVQEEEPVHEEVDVAQDQAAQNGISQRSQNVLAQDGGGAQVGRLVIANTGEVPILIPAGTVVKGGKQDRQIGQDFVVAAGDTVPVDAFCVERGRWTQVREGEVTKGVFVGQALLATKGVRLSGQYDGDQGKVWQEVDATNGAAGKAPATSTLLATIEDEDPAARRFREGAARSLRAHLDAPPGKRAGEHLVGFAYAVDGEPVSVRTFAHPKVLARQLSPFLTTMCLEADLAQRRAKAEGREVVTDPADPERVLAFVKEVSRAKAERKAGAANVNVYRCNDVGGNAACMVQVAPTAEGAEADEGWVPLTEDWTAR